MPRVINLPLVDAGAIRGVPVSDTSPTNGQALVYDATSGQYVPSAVSGSAAGGGSGASVSASYVTLSTDAGLTSERVLTAGTGMFLTDGGAGSTVTFGILNGVVATTSGSTFTQLSGSLQRTAAGLSYLQGVGGVSVTSQSNGQILISASLGNFAPLSPSYLTLGTDATLQSERVLTAGGGITVTDAGAGSTATLGINNSLVATITGSTFTQLSGSLQRLASGVTYLAGAGGTVITTGSSGQVIISSSVGGGAQDLSPYALLAGSTFTGPVTASIGVRVPNNVTLSTRNAANSADVSLIKVDGSDYVTIGNTGGTFVQQSVAGSDFIIGTPADGLPLRIASNVATFTVPIDANAGMSGSLTKLVDGSSYIINGSPGSLSIVTQSNGSIILSASGGSGGGGSSTTEVTGTFRDVGSAFVTTGSVSIDRDNGVATTDGSDVFFYVSGSIGTAQSSGARKVALFGGDVVTSGSIDSTAPLFRTTVNVRNPANTFQYIITPAAIAANRILNLPLITATDTLVVTTLAQTLVGKTLTSPVINTPNFGSNAITTTGAGTFASLTSTGISNLTTISGSLTRLVNGLSAFVGTPSILITTSSANQVIFRTSDQIAALTQSFVYDSAGAGTLTLPSSGSIVRARSARFRVYDPIDEVATSNATPTVVSLFTSGSSGKAYKVNAILTANHTTTQEHGSWEFSSMFYNAGGTMVETAVIGVTSASYRAPLLSASLAATGGNIAVSATGTATGSFNWGLEWRIQEQG